MREDLERCFWEAENDRGELYERSRRQRRFDFAIAGTSWTKDEQTRNEKFQRFLQDTWETFLDHQNRRVTEFRDVIDRHDKIFQSDDKIRQATFDDVMLSRREVLHETLLKAEKLVEEMIESQRQLYEQGRNVRSRETEKLVELFRKVFDKTVRDMKATFTDAQSRRDERACTLVRFLYIVIKLPSILKSATEHPTT